MLPLTSKEKKWTLFFLLPFYFTYGQYVVSFIFLLIYYLLGFNLSSDYIDAAFNMVYMGLLCVMALIIYRSYLKESLAQMKGRWLKEMSYACTLGTIKFYAVNIISSLLILLLSPNSSSTNQNAIEQMTTIAPTFMVITTVFLAPLIEELIFRVGIFQFVYPKSRLLAYLLSSLSFGFVHIMSGLFSGDLSQLLFWLPYSLLGFSLCRMYEKRQSIFVPMVVHSLNNLIAMIAIL